MQLSGYLQRFDKNQLQNFTSGRRTHRPFGNYGHGYIAYAAILTGRAV